MKFRAIILMILLLSFILTACSSGEASSDPFAGLKLATLSGDTAKATPKPTTQASVPASQMVFEDFTSDNGMWSTQNDDYGIAAYENGTFVVTALQEAKTMWSVYDDTFTDVKIEVDAKSLNAFVNDNNGFGVDCRIQENGDGYSFQISSDGYYAIVKFSDTDGSELVEWTQTDAINKGEFTNHIVAICQGNNLELWVNNVFLTSVTDDTFSSGSISLSATTFNSTKAEVSFDNLEVTLP